MLYGYTNNIYVLDHTPESLPVSTISNKPVSRRSCTRLFRPPFCPFVRSTRLPSGAIIIAFHGFEINTVVEHAREEGRGKKIDPTRFDVELECASKVWNNRPIDRQKWDFNFETVRNLIWKILKLERLRKMAINSAQGPYDPQNDSTFYGINCPKGNAHPLHNNNFN